MSDGAASSGGRGSWPGSSVVRWRVTAWPFIGRKQRGRRPASGFHRERHTRSVMVVAVWHGAAQGCRRQCGRGGGAEAMTALSPATRGSRGEAGEVGRRVVPRRRARRGEGWGC
jgi:hypothetical protein